MADSLKGIAANSPLKKLIFDVGAHQGEDSAYYLARGYKVIGFECSPKNIEYLKTKFSREIQTGSFILEERAVVSNHYTDDFIDFYEFDHSVWGTTNEEWKSRHLQLGSTYSKFRVQSLKFSKSFELYGYPNYIKSDIEGSDMAVLHSLDKVEVAKRPEYLSIESSKTSWNEIITELELLRSLGYTRFQVVGQNANKNKISRWSDDGLARDFKHLAKSAGPFGPDLDPHSWLDFDAAVRKYRRIFFIYRFFGDSGIAGQERIKSNLLRGILRQIAFSFRFNKLYDWYDTHASRNL
jgi:FkbM family methyltransferase